MKATANLKINFVADYAETIHRIISPDNAPLPPGIHLDSQTLEKGLKLTVVCERGIDSLWSTLEDIMSAIDLSMKTIDKIES